MATGQRLFRAVFPNYDGYSRRSNHLLSNPAENVVNNFSFHGKNYTFGGENIVRGRFMRKTKIFLLGIALAGCMTLPGHAKIDNIPPVPTPGLVTMVDLGAHKCIPCKMMAPILRELEKEYAGRAEIDFIDVWKNPRAGEGYGIRTIPTQIFYDRNGNEVWRHEGFLSKEEIVAKFKELGV